MSLDGAKHGFHTERKVLILYGSLPVVHRILLSKVMDGRPHARELSWNKFLKSKKRKA